MKADRKKRAAPVLPPTLQRTDPDYTRERYDTRTACLYLMVHREYLYKAVAAGELACFRLHGKRRDMRFSQADLDAYRQLYRVPVAPKVARRLWKPTSVDVTTIPMPKVRRFA